VEPVEAAAGATAHESSGFPPFDQIDTFVSQIFWLVVTFGLLYFCATLWLLPRVKNAIAAREKSIAKDVADAAALSVKADASVKALEARIAEAKARSRDTAAKAMSEADAKISAETAKQEAELAKRLASAEASIAALRAKAMTSVAGVAEDTAAAITQKLTGTAPTPAAVKQAVAAAMRT
jgi:F-type H+-transporting ATPase subunit b